MQPHHFLQGSIAGLIKSENQSFVRNLIEYQKKVIDIAILGTEIIIFCSSDCENHYLLISKFLLNTKNSWYFQTRANVLLLYGLISDVQPANIIKIDTIVSHSINLVI
jgi:hypothetical protein